MGASRRYLLAWAAVATLQRRTAAAVAGAQQGATHCHGIASATYRIEPWGANSLRIRIGADPTVELPQQALLSRPAAPLTKPDQNASACAVSNGNIRASLDGSGRLQVHDVKTHVLLLQETRHSVCAGGQHCIAEVPGIAHQIPPAGSISFVSSAAERLYGLGEHRTGRLDNHGISLDFRDAGVYDHHHAGDIVLPFYISNTPSPTNPLGSTYAFMWNMASFGSFNSSDSEISWSSASTPVLDFWVSTSSADDNGNPFKTILSQFADVTGHPPKMPHFATGFWQCKNRYRSQTELLDTAREYKKRGLPISTIVIDYLHWNHFGDFSLNEKCWPDPAGMIKELDSMEIRAMISIWPFVQSGSVYGHDYNATGKSVNFDAMHERNMLVQDAATGEQAPVFRAPFWEGSTINFTASGANCPSWCPNGSCDPAVVASSLPGEGCNTSLYYPGFPHTAVPHNMYILDPFNPETRKYVFEQMKKNYMKYGIKTFWLDEAEPERHTQDIGIRYGYHDGTDTQIGLAWSRAEQQLVYDGLKSEAIDDDDIFMLSRSFFIGGARYGAGAWSGDIQSSFDELHKQVRIGQNVAMSGIYWWTTDIGGYTGGNAADPEFQQLLIRWFQFGAFCPLFRLHGDRSPELINECGRTGSPNEVWHYGETAYKSIVKVMKLRESIRPYVSSVMAEANETGVPALRPLFMEFPNDASGIAKQGDKVEGTLMLGPDVLLSPVTQYNAEEWQVYLPKFDNNATKWVHHYTNKTYEGGKSYMIDVSDLDTFPLFKRSPALRL